MKVVKNFEITRAQVSDANEIAALVNSAYRGDSSRQGWTTEADLLDGTRTDQHVIADLIKSGTMILKYVENDEILGCVELKPEHEGLYLGMLTVKPNLQNKGIGKVMLNAAEEIAEEHGCSKIFMTVITLRTELMAWYQRHGYIDTGVRKPFAFTDPRFGQPKAPLEFAVLEKRLN